MAINQPVRKWLYLVLSATISFGSTLTASAAVMKDYLRPASVPAPADNQVSAARSELGKMLFFDPRPAPTGSVAPRAITPPWVGPTVYPPPSATAKKC